MQVRDVMTKGAECVRRRPANEGQSGTPSGRAQPRQAACRHRVTGRSGSRDRRQEAGRGDAGAYLPADIVDETRAELRFNTEEEVMASPLDEGLARLQAGLASEQGGEA